MSSRSAATFVREAQAFDAYVRWVWPAQRLLARRWYSRRCTICTASERMVPLDAQGVCELCRQSPPAPSERPTGADGTLAQRLDADLAAAAGRATGDYDALLLFSGGKDSSYLLHRLRRDHPTLRVLAYTFDNGFMSPVALENVRRVVELEGAAHVLVRQSAELTRKIYRYQLTHLGKSGGYGTVDYADGELVLDASLTFATRLDIPLVICGWSRFQVAAAWGRAELYLPAERLAAERTHLAENPIEAVLPDPRDRDVFWRPSRWPAARIPAMVFPLIAWDLPEHAIRAEVVRWGLLTERGSSPLLTNPTYIPLLGVVDVHRDGYSSFEPEFSRMIREGKARAADWLHVWEVLEYAARTGRLIGGLVTEQLEALGLTAASVGIEFGRPARSS